MEKAREHRDRLTAPGEKAGLQKWKLVADLSGAARLAKRVIPLALVIILFATLAALAYYPVIPWSSGQVFGCACYDTPQQIWFLSWIPHVLTSGGNPFYSTSIDVPGGANMLVNTSMIFLSALFAPVTFLLGPVSAINIGMRLAFAASGLATTLVLRKWQLRWSTAFVGGLVYAFSPYMIGQGNGHLQETFVVVPPLWLFIWERLLSRRWRARTAGLWLGALAVIQFFIAIDVLASLLVMSAAALAVVGVLNRHQVKERWPDVLRTVGYAAVVAVPLLAFPAFYTLAGPGAFSGPQQPVASLVTIRADLLSLVVPTSLQRFGPATWIALGSSFGSGNLAENGEYLGIPLVLVLGAIVVRQRRSKLVSALTGVGVIGFVLTLGTSLTVDNHSTIIRLPFDILSHLPLLRDEVPLRFSLYIQLSAAMLLALGLDRGLTRLRQLELSTGQNLVGVMALGVVCLVAILPLWPNVPYAWQSTQVPAFFTVDGAREISPGSDVLTYPYPDFPYDQAMLWQAIAGLRFNLVGGYMYTTTPTGTATLISPELTPPTVQVTLSDSLWGTGDDGLPSGTSIATVASAFRIFLGRYQVSTVIVQLFGAFPQRVVEVVTMATGEQPQDIGGVLLWRLAST